MLRCRESIYLRHVTGMASPARYIGLSSTRGSWAAALAKTVKKTRHSWNSNGMRPLMLAVKMGQCRLVEGARVVRCCFLKPREQTSKRPEMASPQFVSPALPANFSRPSFSRPSLQRNSRQGQILQNPCRDTRALVWPESRLLRVGTTRALDGQLNRVRCIRAF